MTNTLRPASRRLCAVLLAILLMLSAVPTSFADTDPMPDMTNITTAAELVAAIDWIHKYPSAFPAGGEFFEIRLATGANIELETPLKISGSSIYIVGGGTITVAQNFTGGSLIEVTDGYLEIQDSIINAAAGTTAQRRGVTVTGGSFKFGSGTIMGGYLSTGDGGGIYVSGQADFKMDGGSVTENTAYRGGGVFIDTNGGCEMVGGAISDNTALYQGGAVWLGPQSKITMRDCKMLNNKVTPSSLTGYEASTGIYVASGTSTPVATIELQKGSAENSQSRVTANIFFGVSAGGYCGSLYLPEYSVLTGNIQLGTSADAATITSIAQAPAITNEGTIAGSITVNVNGTYITNKNTINGSISYEEGVTGCTLYNSGLVSGDVTAQTEDGVTVTNRGGSIMGTVRGVEVGGDSYNTITVTGTAKDNVRPGGTQKIECGTDITFTINNFTDGYEIELLVGGKSVGKVRSYTFNNVFANHTLEARIIPSITAEVTEKADPEPTEITYTVTANKLNVRSGPGTAYNRLATLTKGATVEGILGDGWLCFDYQGSEAYVSGAYVQPSAVTAWQVIGTRAVTVRSGPGNSYAKIGTLPKRTLLQGTVENGWLRFDYGGSTGYIRARYVQPVNSTALEVRSRSLNVRTGPSTAYEKIDTLTRGDALDGVTAIEDGWVRFAFEGGHAYVYSTYLREAEVSATANKDSGSGLRRIKVIAYSPIHAGPEASYPEIGRFNEDTVCEPLGYDRATQWYKIAFGDGYGWVDFGHVELID